MTKDQDRYYKAAHAMQSCVALDHSRGSQDGTPKHLRVGVNSAMVETSAIAKILIQKGIITEDEWFKAIADGMEDEVKLYRKNLNIPDNVTIA